MLPLSSDNVAIVRIRSATPVRLLHGLVLLPSGISGKMTATLDLITIIAMLVASFCRYAALPITCSSSLPICHDNLMTHKCRGSIVVLSISNSVEPNEEQKEMISSFQQGILCKY